MHATVPIFRNQGESFEADTCEPLNEAARRGKIVLRALVHGHYPGRLLPPGELPGLKTVGYWDARHAQSWGLDWHRNEGIEITFLESGSLEFTLGAHEYALQRDALTVTRPWQRHRLGSPSITPGRLHWLIVDVGVRRPNESWQWPQWIMLRARDLQELASILRQTDRPVWTATPKIRECFRAIAAAINADADGSSISPLTIRINDLLLLLLEHFRHKRPMLDESLATSRRSVELFLSDLQSHPDHLSLDWSVRQMAGQCGLGVTQFVAVVKQLTAMTPFQFLNHQRLTHAAELLRAGSESITAIAQLCGYTSSQYFATAFARRFGCSPSSYRAGQGSVER